MKRPLVIDIALDNLTFHLKNTSFEKFKQIILWPTWFIFLILSMILFQIYATNFTPSKLVTCFCVAVTTMVFFNVVYFIKNNLVMLRKDFYHPTRKMDLVIYIFALLFVGCAAIMFFGLAGFFLDISSKNKLINVEIISKKINSKLKGGKQYVLYFKTIEANEKIDTIVVSDVFFEANKNKIIPLNYRENALGYKFSQPYFNSF